MKKGPHQQLSSEGQRKGQLEANILVEIVDPFGPMVDHVNAVVLPVRDVEKCASFYRDKLGFKLNHKDDESAFLAIGWQGRTCPRAGLGR